MFAKLASFSRKLCPKSICLSICITVLNVPILINSKVKHISQSDKSVILLYQTEQQSLFTTFFDIRPLDFDPVVSIRKIDAPKAAH